MSAPTPAPGDSSPTSGYYPDPSIPGYIRYWNGAAWVPGTSRPAPAEGEPMPVPPGGAEPAPGVVPEQQVAPAEETGPMFLDEGPAAAPEANPAAERSGQPEPASAWGADASRQTGFGGEQARVSWGGEPEPQQQPQQQPPAEQQQSAPPVHPAAPARTDGTVAIRAVQPGRDPQQQPASEAGQGQGQGQNQAQAQQPPADGTMMVRAVRPGQNPGQAPGQTPGQNQGTPQQQPEPGTMAIRALPGQQNPIQPTPPATPQQGAPSGYGYPQGAPQHGAPGSGYGYPQPQSGGPVGAGAGGGAASWPQQVQNLAQGPEAEGGPVTPFKPVADDPFLAAAQAQAAARPAGLGKRLVARLIDTVVVGAVTGAVAVPLLTSAVEHIDGKIEEAKLSGMERTVWLLDGTTSVYLGIVLAVLLVFGALYEALPTSKWGFTLGKKLMKIEVRDIEEHVAPTFSAALRRWLVYCVPGVLAIGALGVLWCTWDRPWRQCWHDKAARTFVAG
ncbi:RDD family protein [Streptomyces sp. Da 82-17]|uniref:RDD family protein n=1 Tax=Streptomyces sp. Da 82-17 TaxID=3377116 RepID=UPI0038D4E6AA